MLPVALVAALLAPAPRLDRDGVPLPPEALRRFGSARWYADPPRSVAFRPDGKAAYLVPVDHGRFNMQDRPPAVSAWEYPSGRPLWTFTDPDLAGMTVAADPDGRTVWLAGQIGRHEMFKENDRPFVRVKLDAATGKESARVKLARGWSTAHALRPDGTLAWNRFDVTPGAKEGDLTLRVLKPDGTDGKLWEGDAEQGIDVIQYAPDGKTLYVSGPLDERRAKLAAVDPATGKTRWVKGAPSIKAVAVSADGQTLAVLGGSLRQLPKTDKDYEREQESLHLAKYDAASGETKVSVKVSDRGKKPPGGSELDRPYPLAFTPDAKAVLIGSGQYGGKAVAVDAAEWLKVAEPKGLAANGWPTPDGMAYLAATTQRTVALLDAKTHDPLPDQPDPLARSTWGTGADIRFAPDGKRVRVGLADFDPATGNELARTTWEELRKQPRSGVVNTAFRQSLTLQSPDGKWLYRQYERDLRAQQRPPELLDAKTELPPEGTQKFTKLGGAVIAFTPDSKRVVGVNSDGTVHLWDVGTGGEPKTEPRLTNKNGGGVYPLLQVAGEYAVVSEPNGGYPFADPKTRWGISRFPFDGFKREKTWTGRGEVENVHIVAGGGIVGWSKLYDKQHEIVPPQRWLFVIDPGADEPREYSIPPGTGFAVSPDGRTAAFGTGSGDIDLYETATGKRRHTFAGLKRIVNSLAFSPDGATLLSESPDGPLLLWDVRGDTRPKLTPTAAGWDDLFRDLSGDDAEGAFRAVRAFAVCADGPAELAKRIGKPNVLTAARAVEAVRLANTDAAKKVLASWAKGDKDSPLTAAARR